MIIVGEGFNTQKFEDYVEGLKFNGWTPNFVVVHNTSSPDLKLYLEWMKRKNWTGEQWMKNLAAYYSGMGWKAGPHLFIAPDKIWVLSPLTARGTHAPSWNSFSWGVETVGEFDREPFDGSPSHTNLVAALAILHRRVGLNPADYKMGVRGLHFHKEDPKTTHKSCPGKNLKKPELIADVVKWMQSNDPGGYIHISEASHVADTSILTPEEITSKLWVQVRLNIWGARPKLAEDGIIGNATKAAVKEFQRNHKLLVDGIAGALTRLVLKQNPNH